MSEAGRSFGVDTGLLVDLWAVFLLVDEMGSDSVAASTSSSSTYMSESSSSESKSSKLLS